MMGKYTNEFLIQLVQIKNNKKAIRIKVRIFMAIMKIIGFIIRIKMKMRTGIRIYIKITHHISNNHH